MEQRFAPVFMFIHNIFIFLSSRLRVTFLMEKGFLHRVKEGFSALQNKYKTKTNAAKQSKQP